MTDAVPLDEPQTIRPSDHQTIRLWLRYWQYSGKSTPREDDGHYDDDGKPRPKGSTVAMTVAATPEVRVGVVSSVGLASMMDRLLK